MRHLGRPAVVALVGTMGVFGGWASRGSTARAAQGEWRLEATETPGVLFWRYNTTGEVQACASTGRPAEFECRRLIIREVDAKEGL